MHLRSGSHRAVALVAAIVASVVLTPTIAHATTADAATTVPSAPRGPLIGSGLNSVYAYWWPPDDDGGLPIVSYTVCTSTDPEVPVATSMCTRIGPTVAAWWQIDGLTPLATYYVRVAAENAAGLGAWTAPSKGAVAATVPGPPASVTVEPGIRSVHVSWTPPTFTGGVEVNGWRICAADTAAAPVATKCATKFPTDPHEITLTVEGGRTYGVTVEAGNEAGIGPPSAAVEVAVPVSPPSTPTGAQITAAERAVEVSWTPPALTGGSPITTYQVCLSTEASVPPATATCSDQPGTSTSATIRGIEIGTPYFAAVTASNAEGPSARSAPTASAAAPYTFAAAPTSVTATAGVTSATVSWVAPTDTGAAWISGYVLTPYRDGVAQQPKLIPWEQTSTTLYDLPRGASYTFRVAAVNAAGAGPASLPTPAVVPTRGRAAYAPFASWDAFVWAQQVDFTGESGSAASRAPAVKALKAGTTTAEAYIESVITSPAQSAAVPPTIRLYWAYFDRAPDWRGLQYWVGARRSGKSLITISTAFAASGEFKRKYGSLSNGAFVDLVYDNVLGRPGDAGGRAYWIRKLNQGMPRGQVMVTFSEGSEYVRRTAGQVAVVHVVSAMTPYSPTPEQLAAWKDESLRDLIIQVFDSDVYEWYHS